MSKHSVLDRLTQAYTGFCAKRGLPQISADEQLIGLPASSPRADHIWLTHFTRIWETHENEPDFSEPLTQGFSPEEFGFRLDPFPVFEETASRELRARLRYQSRSDVDCQWVIWDPEMGADDGILLFGSSASHLIGLLSATLQETHRP